MRTGRLIAALAGATVICAGCASQKKCAPCEPVKVSVRFFAPSPEENYAAAHGQTQGRLVSSNPGSPGFAGSGMEHAVLWGGGFNGNDVSYGSAPLAAGPYMFAFFHPDNGAAYQGWIAVNNGGDDLASAMAEWRDTVHAEQEWLAFENKLDGKFSSRDPNDFACFTRELKTLKNLEAKIAKAAENQAREQYEEAQQRVALLNGTDVLLMPGEPTMLTPATRPAFDEDELELARSGEAVTKVVFAGDYARTMEKLRRVTEMQGDLKRSRAVFSEQVRRYENRGHYYRLTDHIYNHGDKFVTNEQRLQNVHGQIARIDQQLADNGRRVHALLFVAGLFDADEAFKAFDQQQAALERERAVLDAQKCRLDRMFDDLDEMSERRIAVERQRQNLLAEIDHIADQQRDIEQSRVAVAELRDSTNVIHRQGPACVLATSLVGTDLPAKVVDAVSRESLMTVRLQAVETGSAPYGAVTNAAHGANGAATGQGFAYSSQTTQQPAPGNNSWGREQQSTRTETQTFAQPGHGGQQQESQVVLTSHREGDSPAKSAHQGQEQNHAGQKKDGCPWYLKLLVPPCWIAEKLNEKQE